jgi:hypothetical protein
MAKAKSVYAVMYCPESGAPIKTIRITKNKKLADFDGMMKFSKHARKRVAVKVKLSKKGGTKKTQ